MALLHDIQDRFSRAILEGRAEIVTGEILTDGLPAEERYNIYRNNTFITLSQALAQNFPVLCRLVGQTFFDYMAQEYVRKYPPETPLLMTYGDMMAEFLAHFEPAADLSYLADVARLEHLWTECFNGQDSEGFDLGQLNHVAPEKFNDLIFRVLPNMHLMTSDYPVLYIWLANQDGGAAVKEINLECGGCYLAIFRKSQEVEIMTLNHVGYIFLDKLCSGKSLGLAAAEVGENFQDFDLQEALQNILQNGMIAGFEIAGESKQEI